MIQYTELTRRGKCVLSSIWEGIKLTGMTIALVLALLAIVVFVVFDVVLIVALCLIGAVVFAAIMGAA